MKMKLLQESPLNTPNYQCQYQCPFQYPGKRNDFYEDEVFGQKFLGVESGGSLEIHGIEKRPWTRLAETLRPKEKLYSTECHDVETPNQWGGFIVYRSIDIWDEWNRFCCYVSFFDRFNASDASCLGFSDPVKNTQDLEAELSDDSGDVLIILKRDGLQKTPFTNIGDFCLWMYNIGLAQLKHLFRK